MARIPPPGSKPGVMIAVGVPKPGGRIPPPGSKPDAPPSNGDKPEGGESGAKHSTQECLPVWANQHCKDCENWNGQDGTCAEVEGNWDPEDACLRFFEPMGGDDSAEPDADDQQQPQPTGEAQQ